MRPPNLLTPQDYEFYRPEQRPIDGWPRNSAFCSVFVITSLAPSNLIDQLVRDEGERLLPYRDSLGKLTIGVGRNLDDVGISQKESRLLLETDIERADALVRTQLPWTLSLDDVRRAALVNMAFNLGFRILGFTQFLAKLQAGDYAGAAEAMLESRWAAQVAERAQRLSQQIRTGQWA